MGARWPGAAALGARPGGDAPRGAACRHPGWHSPRVIAAGQGRLSLLEVSRRCPVETPVLPLGRRSRRRRAQEENNSGGGGDGPEDREKSSRENPPPPPKPFLKSAEVFLFLKISL